MATSKLQWQANYEDGKNQGHSGSDQILDQLEGYQNQLQSSVP